MKSNLIKLFFTGTFAVVFIFSVMSCAEQNTANITKTTEIKSTAPTNSTQPDPIPVDEFAATREIYKTNCAKCHKNDGTGGDADFDGEKLKVPSYKSEKIIALSDEKYIRVIENGDDGMPAFKKRLQPEEIKDLVRFIRKEFQGK